MKHLILLSIFVLSSLFLWVMPVSAAEDCPPQDASIAPDITYTDAEGRPNFEPLIPQITDYLNAGGSPEKLAAYLKGIQADDDMLLVSMDSEPFFHNFDDDEFAELLLEVSIVHTGFWGGGILLYDCVNGAYELIAQANIDGWTWGDWGFNVMEVVDAEDSGRPRVFIQRKDGIRIAGYAALTWDGAEFVPLLWYTNFADEPLAENQSNGIGFNDLDDDGITEVAMYFHDDVRERAYAYYDIYQIRDEGFYFLCEIYLGNEAFTGDPSTQFIIETLEEADSYFRCGFDAMAEPNFRKVLEDDSLEEVPTGNFGELFERENLRAFSLYRLVLLYARQSDMNAASDAYAQLLAEFPVEVPGSQYTSMAEAFWLEYEQSSDWDSACDALADYLAPTITTILQDDDRLTYALYVSSVAGYPGRRPNSLYRDCSAEIPSSVSSDSR